MPDYVTMSGSTKHRASNNVHYLRVAALVVSWLLPVASTQAADFRCLIEENTNHVYVSGTIEQGDAQRFGRVKTDSQKQIVVFLNSLGGDVAEALQIGELIHTLHAGTVVGADTTCASACALIWLAGDKRFFRDSARIGFHAAYTGSGPAATEDGMANALVGAYLSHLGLSYAAVAFFTSAPPNEMRWLTTTQARRIGVSVDPLDPPSGTPSHAATPVTQSEQRTAEAPRATSKSYKDGRQLRLAYDGWLASLPNGPYRDGVTFWSVNRTTKPNCDDPSMSAPMRLGCSAARGFLGPVNDRTQAERDFRAGWNSL